MEKGTTYVALETTASGKSWRESCGQTRRSPSCARSPTSPTTSAACSSGSSARGRWRPAKLFEVARTQVLSRLSFAKTVMGGDPPSPDERDNLSSMVTLVLHLLRLLPFLCGSHRQLALENLALRHQVAVYKRTVGRPRLRTTDRLFWVGLTRVWAGWRQSLNAETIALVRKMAAANPLWGPPESMGNC